jgi:exoribonuclease-2
VRVRLGAIDDITLDVTGTVIERLDAAAAPVSAEDDSGEEEPVAGPIAIAVDVDEAPEAQPQADNPPS